MIYPIYLCVQKKQYLVLVQKAWSMLLSLHSKEIYQKPSDGFTNQNLEHINLKYLVEQVNSVCFNWFELDDKQSNKFDFDGKRFRNNEVFKDSLISKSIRSLGCLTNRSMEFHILDSNLQPDLAWRLGGFDLKKLFIDSNRVGAAIIDAQVSFLHFIFFD